MQVTKLDGEYDLVLYGLGVMGENFIRNFARKGYRVIGVNRTVPTTARFAQEVAGEEIADHVGTAETLVEACRHLRSPGGAVLAMIKANDPVTQPWGPIDDLFFSGSKARYGDDRKRRCDEFAKRGVQFIGTGVSGGAEGALKGPCIMPGGSRDAYAHVSDMLEAAAAQVDGPCCTYMGDNEAGHFVKNVHNGIEYGIMQAISEVYYALAVLLDRAPGDIEPIFAEMTAGRHGGYLMEISTELLGMVDAETGKPMLDVILDRAGQKGTGKWTSQVAFDLGVPVPTIAAALQARIMSAYKAQRVAAAEKLEARLLGSFDRSDEGKLIAAGADALYGSMVMAYAQGFWLLREASLADPADHNGLYDFELELDEIARIWKGGCIIRSNLLDPIRDAFQQDADLHCIMVAPQFADTLCDAEFQTNWRWWVCTTAGLGLPREAIGASLVYFDTYRTARLPANMIQGQRDRFGEHGFERVDKESKGYHLSPAD